LREIDELSQYSATSRVAAYLLQAAPPEGGAYELPIPKHVLASRLSVKPETLSRIMKQLASDRLISVETNIITILNVTDLRTIADECGIQQDLLRSTFR
jgi:CRP-like cAMP-binding protein